MNHRPVHRRSPIESLESRVMLTAVSRPVSDQTTLGVNYVDWWYDQFETAASDQRITNLANNTASNTIEIVPTWYMNTWTDNTIYQHPEKSLRDSGVIHAIQLSKQLGLKVILKPHVDVLDNSAWRGAIATSNSTSWFTSYKSFINHYADLATTYGADMFCVGTELKTMSGNAFTSQWNSVIDGIEQRFAGPLTYASNWDEFKNVKFWNRMDLIGIDQYTPLGPTNQYEAVPSVDTLVSRWQAIVSDVSSWRTSNAFAQKILLTEIGYQAKPDAHRTYATSGSSYDPDAQKRLYDAATQVWTSQDWMAGLLWWAWHQDAQQNDFSPIGKPAENALKGGSIAGSVFNDLDSDGIKDAGEPGMSGWKIYLDANSNNSLDAGEYSVSTDPQGQYKIDDLLVGKYKVRAQYPAGYGKTAPAAAGFDISLEGGQVDTGRNFGASGNVPPEDNTSFIENFDAIAANTNLPTASRPQLFATTAAETYVRVVSDQSKSGPNSARFHDAALGAAQNYYPQLLVTGLGPSASDGYTSHAVDIAFDYYVPAVADQANYFSDGVWMGLANSGDFTMAAEILIKGNGLFIVNTGGTGGGFVGTVAGGAWHHVAIHLNGIAGGNISFTTKLDDLAPVNTTVPSHGQTDWNNLRWESRDNDGAKDFYLDNIDVHVATAAAGSIAGNVFNDSNSNGAKDGAETGVAGWTVYLDTDNDGVKDAGETSATTDASGNYTFSNLTAGTYNVKQVLGSGYRKTLPGTGTPGYSATVAGAAVTGKDFGVTTNIFIGGTVFNDSNSNGTQDAGENGIQNVVVNILSNGSTVATRTTDANGKWQVKGLAAGTGEANVSIPAGYTATLPLNGKVTGSMTAGQQNGNLNFGLHVTGPAPVAAAFRSSSILLAMENDLLDGVL